MIISEDRHNRMEDRRDKLSEAVLAIARMEERMLTVFKRLENVNRDLKKIDDRIDEMEKQTLDDQGFPSGSICWAASQQRSSSSARFLF